MDARIAAAGIPSLKTHDSEEESDIPTPRARAVLFFPVLWVYACGGVYRPSRARSCRPAMLGCKLAAPNLSNYRPSERVRGRHSIRSRCRSVYIGTAYM